MLFGRIRVLLSGLTKTHGTHFVDTSGGKKIISVLRVQYNTYNSYDQ